MPPPYYVENMALEETNLEIIKESDVSKGKPETVIYEGLLILPISYNKIAKESKNSPFKPPLSPTKEPTWRN